MADMPTISPIAPDAPGAPAASQPSTASAEVSAIAAQAAPQADAPSLTERAHAAIAELSHAMNCNAPIAPTLLRELKDLLGVA